MGLFDFMRRPTTAVVRADNATTLTMLPTGVEVGAWGNSTSGLGVVGYDPTRQLQYGAGYLPSSALIDKLYTFDWLADRIIELMPSIAMVRGIRIKGAKDGGDELIRKWQAIDVSDRFPRGAFRRGVNDGRAYGGSVMLNGYALGNPASELTPEQAAGGINFFDIFGQHELRVLTRFSDPSQGDLGMPELYQVVANGNGPPHPRRGQIFHSSRSVRFAGRPLRVPNTAMDLVGDFPDIGVSVLTPVLNVIAQYGLAWASLSNLLQDASMGVMKLSGLVEGLSGEDAEIIRTRLQVMQQTRGAHRMVFLDAENGEEYTRTEVSLTDIPAVMQQFMVSVAGAASTPARIFFSSSPSGLNANASGNTDLAQFYADCEDYQRTYLGPKLEAVLTAVNGGTEPVRVEWPSLWVESQNEKAQTRSANANADKVFWDMGYSAGQVGKARAAGTFIELTGQEAEDSRDDVAGAGGEDELPPNGAPGAAGAAKIATKQRAAQKK